MHFDHYFLISVSGLDAVAPFLPLIAPIDAKIGIFCHSTVPPRNGIADAGAQEGAEKADFYFTVIL